MGPPDGILHCGVTDQAAGRTGVRAEGLARLAAQMRGLAWPGHKLRPAMWYYRLGGHKYAVKLYIIIWLRGLSRTMSNQEFLQCVSHHR